MNYLYVSDGGILAEIIKDEDETFPGIPASERYTKEFLDSCVERSDEQIAEEGIVVGMLYDTDTDTFHEPKPTPEQEPKPEGYTITEEEVNTAYKEGINNVE